MCRPDKNCKLCWKEFETEYTDKTARDHYDYKTVIKKVIFAEFRPCMHRMVCDNCANNKKYTECPFCSEPIKQALFYNTTRNEWVQGILYSNSN